MKQQITDVESQIIDVEEVKVISEKAVEEGVKSVARKSKKAVKK